MLGHGLSEPRFLKPDEKRAMAGSNSNQNWLPDCRSKHAQTKCWKTGQPAKPGFWHISTSYFTIIHDRKTPKIKGRNKLWLNKNIYLRWPNHKEVHMLHHRRDFSFSSNHFSTTQKSPQQGRYTKYRLVFPGAFDSLAPCLPPGQY